MVSGEGWIAAAIVWFVMGLIGGWFCSEWYVDSSYSSVSLPKLKRPIGLMLAMVLFGPVSLAVAGTLWLFSPPESGNS